jgi:GR25 family glycosyltransferase involved in LPS biosynthesis
LIVTPELEDLLVFVISVQTYSERHEHIKVESRKCGLEIDFIFEFDAIDLSESDLARVDRSIGLGASSCVLKHVEAQKRLLKSGAEIGLVLEDDAVFFHRPKERLEAVVAQARKLQPGWLISLGGADEKFVGNNVDLKSDDLIAGHISTAECYLIDRVGCELRYDWMRVNQINKPADHFLKEIDQLLNIPQYRVYEPLCTQGSISGRFHTTLDSSRSGKSLHYLAARYKWRRFFKQILPRKFRALSQWICR